MLNKNKKAFSVVEVVLVLAVAGLIFIMVFFAVPTIRRRQHNTQRKDDLSRFVTAINDYSANNGGEFPMKNVRVGYGHYSTSIHIIDVKYLVQNYIDPECKFWSGSDNSFNFLIDSSDNCSEAFRAPDGAFYSISPYGGNVFSSDCNNGFDIGSICSANDFKNNYDAENEILIYRGYSCAEDEGLLRKAPSERTFALMTRLEGNSIACADND